MASSERDVTYSQFACIGAGFSGIGLGATLKRWYGITDLRIFERETQLGGTWHINQYPGAACDIPSVLYSFSYEPNADWSRDLPAREELFAYLKKVADKYDIPARTTFGVSVELCEWIEERNVWRLSVRDNKTGDVRYHESQFLFAASGLLITPRELDVPGTEAFKGSLFHSARWRHDVDLTDKRVVLFGNGCTATQIVPEIVGKTKHLTQIVRSKHWIVPPSISHSSAEQLRWVRNHIPGSMLVQRFLIFWVAEWEYRGFTMSESAAKFRKSRAERATRYIKSLAPKKYWDLLIPDFEIGCKRRIFNTGYLESTNSDNFTLTDEPALEIVPEGVRTKSGVIPADVIVTANGFKTGNGFMPGITVVGRNGETVDKHWEEFGGAEAYNSCAMSGFPNFFVLLGPNAATGHTSAVMASENSINYALRVIKPVLDGQASSVEIKREAEEAYVNRVQTDLQKTVFASGCKSWYVQEHDGGKRWNDQTYPWTQAYYWYRSLFPVWNDWKYSGTRKSLHMPKLRKLLLASVALFISILVPLCRKRAGTYEGQWLSIYPAFRASINRLTERWL